MQLRITLLNSVIHSTYVLTTDNRPSVWQSAFNIRRRLLTGNHTRRPANAARCAPLGVRQRRAVHLRQQIYLSTLHSLLLKWTVGK